MVAQNHFFLTSGEDTLIPAENRAGAPMFCPRVFETHACLTCALREQTISRIQYQLHLDRLQHV